MERNPFFDRARSLFLPPLAYIQVAIHTYMQLLTRMYRQPCRSLCSVRPALLGNETGDKSRPPAVLGKFPMFSNPKNKTTILAVKLSWLHCLIITKTYRI